MATSDDMPKSLNMLLGQVTSRLSMNRPQEAVASIQQESADQKMKRAVSGHTKKYRKTEQITDALRSLPILEVLGRLGLYFKEDRSYTPRDSRQSKRFHVQLETGVVVELLITGEKWYDPEKKIGRGGAIDLVMYLYGEPFKKAIKRLEVLFPDLSIINYSEIPEKPKTESLPVPVKKHLTPRRSKQVDFFVADILGWVPKDDVASMEHPLFALKAGDKRIRVYERNGITVKVAPGYHGHATIHDKDLWIYCISRLVDDKRNGKAIDRTVQFVMKDFLKAINRDTSGRAYKRAEEMLERLKGTSITTNIKTAGISEKRGFGLIDSWKVVERDSDKRMISVEITLSDWLFRSIDSMQVLTLSPDYFRLRKALDRRIYELARKHCGQQPMWKVSIAVLHQKSGSGASLRRFRFEIRELVDSGELPDYFMSYDEEDDKVIFSQKEN